MACEHKRLKSVNCVIMCADCGAVVPVPVQGAAGERTKGDSLRRCAPPPSEREALGDGEEPTVSASGRKIGLEAEPKKRGRKKKEE